MKVSVGRDSENSIKIVTVQLKSGRLATMNLLITRSCSIASMSKQSLVFYSHAKEKC